MFDKIDGVHRTLRYMGGLISLSCSQIVPTVHFHDAIVDPVVWSIPFHLPVMKFPAFYYVIIREGAQPPVKTWRGSAGYDVASAVKTVLPAGTTSPIPLGFALTPPKQCYARLTSRSGLVANHNLCVLSDVVDPDYRGEYHAILTNLSAQDYHIGRGDRIAQIVFERFEDGEGEELQCLPPSSRGVQGFGSTGVRVGSWPLNYREPESDDSDDDVPPLLSRHASATFSETASSDADSNNEADLDGISLPDSLPGVESHPGTDDDEIEEVN